VLSSTNPEVIAGSRARMRFAAADVGGGASILAGGRKKNTRSPTFGAGLHGSSVADLLLEDCQARRVLTKADDQNLDRRVRARGAWSPCLRPRRTWDNRRCVILAMGGFGVNEAMMRRCFLSISAKRDRSTSSVSAPRPATV
jgi:hypothetical protein